MNHPQTETTFRFWGWVLMAIAIPLGLELQASLWVEDRALSPATAMGQEQAPARQPAVEFSAKKIESAHMENLHRIELKPAQALANQQAINKQAIWFGGSPETDAAMAELAASGVKTIVSVDGAPPLVELAKKHGLKYVHIPVKYSALSREQIVSLAAVLQRTGEPVYVHCHHGKHRGPAALVAALKCTVTDLETDTLLKTFGTDPKYRGLYEAARTAQPLQAQELARVPEKLPEAIQDLSPARLMSEIDCSFDQLLVLRKMGEPLENKEFPAQLKTWQEQAIDLEEAFREYQRLLEPQFPMMPPEQQAQYRKFLKTSLSHAAAIRTELTAAVDSSEDIPARLKTCRTNLEALQQSCAGCHAQFRN